MSMTVTRRKEDKTPRVIMHRIADIRGGVSVATSELGGDYLAEGAVLSAADENGLCHVIKTAQVAVAAQASDTSIKVAKGHNFAKGDAVTTKTGGAAYAITAIDTASSKAYDTITVGTALGALEKGTVIFEAKAAGSASALKYTPQSLNGTGKPFRTDSNLNTDAWLIAVTKDYALPDSISKHLTGIINY